MGKNIRTPLLPRRFRMFATCTPGAESCLRKEVKALKMAKVEQQVGGVQFEGDLKTLYKANLCLRTAIRILVPIARFSCESNEELYKKASEVCWADQLNLRQTFAIDHVVYSNTFRHSQYASRLVKDAIVDQFMEKHGRRPSVDPDTPDVQFNLYIQRKRCTISLDSTVLSLHQRGYRREAGSAPLNEALAAALLDHSNWDLKSPIIDPMCGSGTLLIEAAMKAKNIAPGSLDRPYGFMNWQSFNQNLWDKVKTEATQAQEKRKMPILMGYDIDPKVIKVARKNAQKAGVEEFIRFEQHDVRKLELRSGWNAWIITNPPYGERIGNPRKMISLYQSLGKFLAQHSGYQAYIFTSNEQLVEAMGMECKSVESFKNGGIDCCLWHFPL